MPAMTIREATRRYETWLGTHTPLVNAHVALKHAQMKTGAFPFLRATFYRWMQLWPEICPTPASAPKVLAVGDLHVENFGTWRDLEGRLVWGVNDFDEVFPLPYTIDLVRLAASARLAIAADHLAIKPKNASEAILSGYRDGLKAGGRPFVLAEQHPWLRDIATGKLRDPVRFWEKLMGLPPVKKEAVPAGALEAIERLLPERGIPYRLVRRVSGLGSLGRHRFVALADWRGGKVAREAKALVSSACLWARHGRGTDAILYQDMLDRAVRCRDPFVHLRDRWIVRRLSPYCSRIELAALPASRDESRLLYAMGWETANIHLGSPKAVASIRRDLEKQPARWLQKAAKAMVKATIRDYKEWAAAG